MKYIAVAATVLLSTTSAFAADVVVAEQQVEVVATTFDWSGVYVGAQIGYGSGEFSTDLEDLVGLPIDIGVDVKGIAGGGYAGWNFQHDQFVFGLETDFNASGVDEAIDLATLGAPAGSSASVEYEWFGSTRARVGLAADRFLPFVTFGVSYAKAKAEFDVPAIASLSETETYVGWTAGAGLEFAFTENLIGRAEYRYSDFGSKDWGTGAALGTSIDFDAKLHTGTIGIAYKF